MIRPRVLGMLLCAAVPALGLAAEGMWPPEALPPAETLQGMGLSLPRAQLADPGAAPLGAIVSVGGYCSGAFVSADGLVVTNHHCVSALLQANSTAEQNRARDGHVAKTRAEELSGGPAARVYVVEGIEDVTAKVHGPAKKAKTDLARFEAADKAQKQLIAACEATAGRRCEVVADDHGRAFRLITYREHKDVRVVYAPPESVGSYGGEIDNWMWPRHAGDFALIRVYVGPEGQLDAGPNNVPYRPPHHLKVSAEGVKPGDFVMAAGYPGSTERYGRYADQRYQAEVALPAQAALLEEMLTVLREESARDPEGAARLASPIDGLANYQKYVTGLLDNLEASPILAQREAEAKAIAAWAAADPARSAHVAALAELERISAEERAERAAGEVQWLMFSSDLLTAAHTSLRAVTERTKPDLKRDQGFQERDQDDLLDGLYGIDDSLWIPAERRLVELGLRKNAALPEAERIAPLQAFVEARGGIDKTLALLYTSPALADAAARKALFGAPLKQVQASTDPWVQLALALETWLAPRRDRAEAIAGARLRLEPLYMEAARAVRASAFYPDANNTLRWTFGAVKGYSPADGVLYTPQTTLPGLVAKAGPAPFDAPARLLAAAAGESSSRWVDPALGHVPVDFLSDLDTTGGNSGSATLNHKGELVGLVFDGNYESMSADWIFDPALTRTIHVDVRYLLWTLEEVEGAAALVKELGF